MTKEFLLELSIYCFGVGIGFTQASALIIMVYRKVVPRDYIYCFIASIFMIAGIGILIYLGIQTWLLWTAAFLIQATIVKILIERHK